MPNKISSCFMLAPILTKDDEPKKYAGVIALRKGNRIGLPGGKREKGEYPLSCVEREVREEGWIHDSRAPLQLMCGGTVLTMSGQEHFVLWYWSNVYVYLNPDGPMDKGEVRPVELTIDQILYSEDGSINETQRPLYDWIQEKGGW